MSVKSFLLLLSSVFVLNACAPKLPEKMDKETFWLIIETAKKQSGTNMEVRAESITAMLSQYSAEDILKFGEIAGAYIYAAEENMAVWAACKAIEGYASDDTFLYFCCWLVSQGQDIYTKAVKNPDSLATEETAKYEYREFESLLYCAYDAYERKTDNSYEEVIVDYTEEELKTKEEARKVILEGVEFMDDTPFKDSELEAKTQIPLVFPRLTEMFGYDVEAEVKEMEELEKAMSDPQAAKAMRDSMLRQLQDMGVDISLLPEFE